MQGARCDELMREALLSLSVAGHADRAGVWIETGYPGEVRANGAAKFHGKLWDRESDSPPPDWERFSPEAPLPLDLLLRGESAEWNAELAGSQLLIGPLIGMSRALWVPIAGSGQLRGLLLVAARKSSEPLPRSLAESVAAEMALALENECAQLRERKREADLLLVRNALEALAAQKTGCGVLTSLVAECTAREPHGAGNSTCLSATFAVIGRTSATPQARDGKVEMEFAWKSGSEVWTHAIESEPLSHVWRNAVATRRVATTAPHVAWMRNEVGQVVALPLEYAGEICGVFIAGLRPQTATPAAQERLELRAALAATALQQALQRDEAVKQTAWQETLLGSSREATALLDGRGMITGISGGLHELLGAEVAKSVAPGVGTLWAELFEVADKAQMASWSREVLAGGGAGDADIIEGKLRNGARVRVQAMARGEGCAAVRLQPMPDAQATAQTGRDELALREALEWLEDGVVVFDANERVRVLNTRFAQLIGLAAREVAQLTSLGALIERVAPQTAQPESFAKRWRALTRDADGGERSEVHIAVPVPRVLERTSRRMLDPAGQRLGRVEIYRDVSAQRVFHAQLLQTEKLAALGQMVSGLAHELSNPLTTILGTAQRLLASAQELGRTSEVQQIYQEADRAGRILRQLLLSSRDARPERQRVSLNQIVFRAAELQRFQKSSRTIHVEQQLDSLLPFLQGDAGQLQQVLINLIGNAQQAIEQSGKGGLILLRTKRLSAKRVLLEVSDDGPGIAKSILPRIFDPFFTTKPAGVGTGLGLAVVLSVVREHGGQMKVRNEPGGGTTFSVELPAGEARPVAKFFEAAEQGLAPASQERRANGLPSGSNAVDESVTRALVVEDEPTVARLIADVLEDEGLDVDVMLDGREALQRAASENYGMVVCDMKMPGVDGQHFFKALERTRNPLRERLLFVTGDVIAPHTQQFLERNHLPHVAKPFRVEELLEAVRRMLGGTEALLGTGVRAAKKQAARNG